MLAHESEGKEVQKCKILIMTSAINHKDTVKFFEMNNYFGAVKENVVFFQQSVLPAISPEGKILMEDTHKIVMAPNGNGALFDAVNRNPEVKKVIIMNIMRFIGLERSRLCLGHRSGQRA